MDTHAPDARAGTDAAAGRHKWLVATFVCLITVQAAATERSRAPGVPRYGVWHAVAASELTKLLVNVAHATWVAVRSAEGWRALVPRRGLLGSLAVRYAVPALGYTAANAFGLFAVDAAGATGALVAGQLKVPTTAAIWQPIMGRRMSGAHWACIFGTVTCCFVYELLRTPVTATAVVVPNLWRLYVPTVAGSVASAIAGASNERLLKRHAEGKHVHASVHNVCLCANAGVAALVMVHASGTEPLPWSALLAPPTALAVGLHAAVGLSVSAVLKELSLPHKAIAGTLAAPASVGFARVMLGTPLPSLSRLAALTGVAVCASAFHLLPVPKSSQKMS